MLCLSRDSAALKETNFEERFAYSDLACEPDLIHEAIYQFQLNYAAQPNRPYESRPYDNQCLRFVSLNYNLKLVTNLQDFGPHLLQKWSFILVKRSITFVVCFRATIYRSDQLYMVSCG